jgi:hypothetical protein
MLRNSARCSHCGGKGASLRHPSWGGAAITSTDAALVTDGFCRRARDGNIPSLATRPWHRLARRVSCIPDSCRSCCAAEIIRLVPLPHSCAATNLANLAISLHRSKPCKVTGCGILAERRCSSLASGSFGLILRRKVASRALRQQTRKQRQQDSHSQRCKPHS